MNENKSLLTRLSETLDEYRADRRRAQAQDTPSRPGRLSRVLRWLTPNGGTLLLIAALIATAQVWARPLASPASAPGPSATTVNYQGRLADSGGTPLDGTYGMSFSLWDASSGGNLIWGPESHAAVPVAEGLFSVGLGSQTSGGIPTSVWNGDRYLEITVGGETLSPRELIRSVPIAGMALTVPDGAIGTDQIADGAVTQVKAPFAPLTYWYSIDSTPDPNMKLAVVTAVFDPGGSTGRDIDISAYGFTSRPLGICEISDTSETVAHYFCAYSWDGSNTSTAHIGLFSYDDTASGPSGLIRITLFLMGKG